MSTSQLALFTPLEEAVGKKIRSELNLEKWSIWMPSQSRVKHTEIVRERETTRPDGSKEQARVTIQSVGKLGLFTTEDQKTYYALIKIWEEKGKPDGPTAVSIRQLAQILKKGWGSKVLKSLTESLLRLRTVPFIWENSYYNAATKETEENLNAFTILEDLKLHRTRKDGHVNKEQGFFQFNRHILKNLQANYTKPLCLDVILTFQSEIAQLLYTYLDLIMADKNHYERRSEGLFADLGLEGKTYRNLSDRKRKLERAVKELQGVQLSTGILVEAALTETKDEKDIKVVFRKQPFVANKLSLSSEPESQRPPASDEVTAVELVAYFHARLGRPTKRPTVKELGQAAQILALYDADRAYYIVDYALCKARETQFDMQTFGAVLQYTDAAVQAYTRQHAEHVEHDRLDRELTEHLHAELEAERNEQMMLEEWYQALPVEQQQALEAQVLLSLQQQQILPDAAGVYYAPVLTAARYQVWRACKAKQERNL